VTRLRLAHPPFLPHDFPFLPSLERKTSFGRGGDKRAVCYEMGPKIPFPSGLSKLFRFFYPVVKGKGPPCRNSNVRFSLGFSVWYLIIICLGLLLPQTVLLL
jgi:hypothetical protein